MLKRVIAFLFSAIFVCHTIAQERTLDFYIKQGLSSSPLLKDYQNQIKSNLQDSLLVKALLKPQVNATGQILVPPYGKNFGYDEAITNGGNYSAVIGVTQLMFKKNPTMNKMESIGLQNKAIANSTKLTEEELKKLITSQYITAYTSYNEILFGKEIHSLLKDEEQVLKLLAEKGDYKQSDYLSFQIEEQVQETAIMQQQIDFKQELYRLNAICGITDTITYKLADPGITQTNNPDYQTSVIFAKFRLDSLINLNSRKTLDFNYVPNVSWFTDAGINSTDPLQAYRRVGFSFGLNVTMPVYDGKQKKMEIQKLIISDDSRRNYQDFYKKQYDSKQMRLNEKVKSYNQLSLQVQKQLKSIEELIQMNKLQLNIGDLSITEHILAVKNYIETKHQLNVLQLEKLQTINELNYIDVE